MLHRLFEGSCASTQRHWPSVGEYGIGVNVSMSVSVSMG